MSKSRQEADKIAINKKVVKKIKEKIEINAIIKVNKK